MTAPAQAYELDTPINPQIAAQPIEVVYWVQDGVTPQAEASTMATIEQALAAWEAVPTACVSFHKNRVVHSASPPSKAPSELMAVVSISGSSFWGGSAPNPNTGNPNYFVLVGMTTDQNTVALHESGHALGLGHSTVSSLWPQEQRSVMNWTSTGFGLQADDIAGVSVHYPCAQAPLGAVSGTIQGRLLTQHGAAASGVNVIAYNVTTNRPTVARVTGQTEQAAGTFSLRGVPPGTYRLLYRDGTSFGGYHLPVQPQSADGYLAGFQTDNFAAYDSTTFTVSAGQTLSMGDLAINIEEMSIDGVTEFPQYNWSLTSPWLPPAQTGTPYARYLHIRGGLRDLAATVMGLPSGLTATLSSAGPGVTGRVFLKISGTPTQAGFFPVTINLTDRQNRTKSFKHTLSVGPLGGSGTGLVARYELTGNGADWSGNGHTASIIGGSMVTDRHGWASSAVSLTPNSYIQLADESAFDLSTYSLVMVLKLPPTNWQDDWLITKGSGGFGGFGIRRASVLGGLGIYGHRPAGSPYDWEDILGYDPLPVDQSFCLAVTVDANAADTYVNGVLQLHSGSPPAPAFNNEPVRIGVGGDVTPNTYLTGIVDDVSIFRGKLTPAQVAAACL